MLLEGKIILVSGGTRGLGAGIARAAAADGAAGIMITGRDPTAGKSLARTKFDLGALTAVAA